MKVMMIPVVISALGIILTGLLKEMEDLETSRRVETIQLASMIRYNDKKTI